MSGPIYTHEVRAHKPRAQEARGVSARAKRGLMIPRGIAAVLAPGVALAGVAALWALSLRNIDLGQMTDLGLVSALPATYFVALALLTASFAFAVHDRETPPWVLFLHVVLLIVLIHGTPSLVYGTVRYAWTWKHIGMVDYILRHGAVNPDISALSGLSANHNWPGFFALSALFTQVGGFTGAQQFAALAPLFFNLIDIGPLLLIFGAFIRDSRLRWLAVWTFFLGNWVGQDYFAPQALTYFLFLVAVGICLTWFSARPRPPAELAGRPWWLRWPERIWSRLDAAQGAQDDGDGVPRRSTPLQRVGLMALIVLLAGVIASSHQLTPFMAILSFGALVLAYRSSARTLPILMAVITATWAMYIAWAFVGGNLAWIIDSFGELGRNSTVTDVARVSQGQALVALAARGLTALIGLLGFAGFVRRWRKGKRDLAYLALAAAPFPMLVANSYGGEMMFRVYFFALPYVALFAAALIYPAPGSGTSWRAPLGVMAVSGLLLGGLLLAYGGRERMNYFTPNEVDAATYLYRNAPAGALVIGASDNYPSLFQNYEQYTHVALTGRTAARGQQVTLESDPLTFITTLMNDDTFTASYLIITRSQKAQIEMDGLLPPGTMEHIEQLLRRPDRFRIIYENEDAVIFTPAGRPESAP